MTQSLHQISSKKGRYYPDLAVQIMLPEISKSGIFSQQFLQSWNMFNISCIQTFLQGHRDLMIQQFIIRIFFLFSPLSLQEFLFQEDPAFSQLFPSGNTPWRMFPLLPSALTFQEKRVCKTTEFLEKNLLLVISILMSQKQKLEELIFKL